MDPACFLWNKGIACQSCSAATEQVEKLHVSSSTLPIPYFHSNIMLQADSSHKQGTASLRFVIENASHNVMHNLWSAMGGKYRPSTLYKVRYVRIQSNELKGVNTEVQATQTKART